MSWPSSTFGTTGPAVTGPPRPTLTRMTSTRPEIALPPTAPHPQADPDAARRTYELDRAHVFHSWSAQAALTPLVVAGAGGARGGGGGGPPHPPLSRPP